MNSVNYIVERIIAKVVHFLSKGNQWTDRTDLKIDDDIGEILLMIKEARRDEKTKLKERIRESIAYRNICTGEGIVNQIKRIGIEEVLASLE